MALGRRVRVTDSMRWRWPSATVYTLCAFYAATATWLLLWATVPVLGGLRPVAIVSDSMAPLIRSGDVVMMRKPPAARLAAGTVITFEDAGVPGRLLTHRIVSRNGDGTYQTKGDANPTADSTAVAPEDIRGVGSLMVPAVGLPIRLVLSGQWFMAAAWALGSVMAVVYVTMYPRFSSLRMWGWSSPQVSARRRRPSGTRLRRRAAEDPRHPAPTWSAPYAPAPMPLPMRKRIPLPIGVGVTIAVFVLVATIVPATSSAAWSAQTQNSGNALRASGCFPRTITVTPNADTVVREDLPTTAAGTGTSIAIQSSKSANWRTLIRFTLPADRGTCSITATLRLNLHTGIGGRAVQAQRATGAWAETAVTWNTQPGVGTTTATSAPFTSVGWVPLDVSALVAEQYAQGNNGLMLRDTVENKNGGADTNYFYSREGTSPPQLVLTLAQP